MSTVQPTRAPTQLEELSSEELLGHYCEGREDLYALALWKRIADRQLKWMARRFCPRRYEPDWMELACFNRALRRFKKHICKFIGQLETPSFGAYIARLLKSAVIDEYRFVKGQGRAIMVQFGAFDVVDDTGTVIRTKREEETDLLEQLARAREEDERAISGEEENEAEPARDAPEEVPDRVGCGEQAVRSPISAPKTLDKPYLLKSAFRLITSKRGLIAVACLLIVGMLAGYLNFRKGLFDHAKLGVALADFEISDLSKGERIEAERFLFSDEIESLLTTDAAPQKAQVKNVHSSFRTHEEVREWGRSRGVAFVIWGTAERGPSGLLVHIKATRLLLPELQHRNETFRRAYVQKIFPEYFRDADVYATDFDAGDLAVDLGKPAGMSLVRDTAADLTRFLSAVIYYTDGDYKHAATILEKLAGSNATGSVRNLAQRWLVLTYLNARRYAAAEKVFSKAVDQKSIDDADMVRYAFLRALAGNGVFYGGYALSRDEIQKLWKIVDSGRLPPYFDLTVLALLSNQSTRIDPRWFATYASEEEAQRRIQIIENSLRRAAASFPNDYFVAYLRGMLTTHLGSEDALKQAEQLKPSAPDPHMGMALILRNDGDLEGALGEIDKAIALDQSHASYAYEKFLVLSELADRTIGKLHNLYFEQQVPLLQGLINNNYGSKADRAYLTDALAWDYVALEKPEAALSILQEEAPILGNEAFCQQAAVLTMRQIAFLKPDALSQVPQFINCSGHLSASSPFSAEFMRNPVSRLELEFLWRNGELDSLKLGFQQASQELFNFDILNEEPAKIRYVPNADVSAMLDVYGNMLHAEGRYADAEALLLRAEGLAAKLPRRQEMMPEERFRVFESEQGGDATRSRLRASFDLAMVHLSAGKYAEAAQNLHDAREYLLKDKSCQGNNCTSLYQQDRYLALMVDTCLGYAHFKAGDYLSADHIWSDPFQIFLNDEASRSDIHETLAADLLALSEHPTQLDGETLLRIMNRYIVLRQYPDAAHFIGKYIAAMDAPDPAWIPRSLVVALGNRDPDRVEREFEKFLQWGSGGLKSNSRFAGLASTINPVLNHQTLADPPIFQTPQSPTFFWDVIAGNRFP